MKPHKLHRKHMIGYHHIYTIKLSALVHCELAR